MIRFIFFSLLLANLIIVLWVYANPSAVDSLEKLQAIPEDKRLILLAETRKEAPLPPTEDIPIAKTICYTAGPFAQIANVIRIEKRLQSLQLLVKRRTKIDKQLYGYRVYIPSPKSREHAVALAKELDDFGIHDYFIVNEEDRKNAISLGLFRQKIGGVKRMAQVRRFGFSVDMEARYRGQKIYWLDLTDPQQQLSDALWKEFVEGLPQAQRLERDCKI